MARDGGGYLTLDHVVKLEVSFASEPGPLGRRVLEMGSGAVDLASGYSGDPVKEQEQEEANRRRSNRYNNHIVHHYCTSTSIECHKHQHPSAQSSVHTHHRHGQLFRNRRLQGQGGRTERSHKGDRQYSGSLEEVHKGGSGQGQFSDPNQADQSIEADVVDVVVIL